MYEVKRTDQEINDQINLGSAWEEKGGTAVRGMSFEQGVKQGIDWVIGHQADAPIEEGPE